MSNKFNFDKTLARVRQAKAQLPNILAKQAEGFWSDNFRAQCWEGSEWKVPQRRIPGTKAYKYPLTKGLSRRTKGTLIGTGALRRAVSNSSRVRTPERVVWVVDLPYAAAHNYGKDGMPQRKFMGDHRDLRRKQLKTINDTIRKAWR